MNGNRKVLAVALGVVAMTSCSSSAKSSSTTTTAPVRANTSTTRKRSGESTTTTNSAPSTTIAPATSSSRAVSASFVSASHGWALAAGGRIDETADGGHRWHRVGTVPSHGENQIIRFLSDADGFAFARLAGPLLVTHDAGATWTTTPTPFKSVSDLAIARGMVYAVAPHPGSTFDFRIWSTPVAHLVWKQDPLTLEVGAGPVPEQQIVLNGGHGWILNQDRTVISGARLASNGTWTAWKPPCLQVRGPAFLTASTGTDLVAACDEGVWGNPPPMAPAIRFSHNGGASFVRRTAPVFGAVLSPNAQTAVVAGSQTVQRTTDGGATWSVVAHTRAGDATDSGFTSSTQGFIITGGQMLMTYDAGATWQPVTLP